MLCMRQTHDVASGRKTHDTMRPDIDAIKYGRPWTSQHTTNSVIAAIIIAASK